MQGLKKFGLVVAVTLFGPLFLLSIASLAFNRTLGDQEYTKQTIKEAGFYKAVGETIKTEALGDPSSPTDPTISAALDAALAGDNLQNSLEPLIDGVYSWLSGQAEQPEFNLAIEPIKQTFQQSLTASLQARAASLPACSQAVPLTGEDVFTYNCIPPGTDVNAVISDSVTKISGNASVFSDEVVADGNVSTAEAQELGINDPAESLPDSLPKLFQFLGGGQWFFVVGALLTAIGTILLSLSWKHGIRKLGILLLINGLGILVIGLVMGFAVSTLIPTTSVEATQATINAVESASKIILADNAAMFKTAGLVSVVVGIVGIVASTIVINKDKGPKGSQSPEALEVPKEKQP